MTIVAPLAKPATMNRIVGVKTLSNKVDTVNGVVVSDRGWLTTRCPMTAIVVDTDTPRMQCKYWLAKP